MTNKSTTNTKNEEVVPIRRVKRRRAKKMLAQTVHRDLRIVIIGSGPLPCALARILGNARFLRVTLLADGGELKTFSYINETLLHRVYTFLRESAFPDSLVESSAQQSAASMPRVVAVNSTRISSLDPIKKHIVLDGNKSISYDVLVYAAEVGTCRLQKESTTNDMYITRGHDVLDLHRMLAERVARAPKREMIDLWCDTSQRLGKELHFAMAEKLPEFAYRYGHPRETVHVHTDADEESHLELETALRVHMHQNPDHILATDSELLASPGHVIMPPFGQGLDAVDAAHDIAAHIAEHPMGSVRIMHNRPSFYYTSTFMAGNGESGSFIGWILLRLRDFSRAVRAYGFIAGIHAWRGMKI